MNKIIWATLSIIAEQMEQMNCDTAMKHIGGHAWFDAFSSITPVLHYLLAWNILAYTTTLSPHPKSKTD